MYTRHSDAALAEWYHNNLRLAFRNHSTIGQPNLNYYYYSYRDNGTSC